MKFIKMFIDFKEIQKQLGLNKSAKAEEINKSPPIIYENTKTEIVDEEKGSADCCIPGINTQFLGLFFALLNALAEATCSSLMKLSSLPPPMLSTLRSTLQVIVCAPILLYKQKGVIGGKGDRLYLLLHGTLSLGLVGRIFSVYYIPVGEATAIFFSAPLFTMVFARIFLKEPFGKFDIFGSIFTFIGVILVIDLKNINRTTYSTLTDQIIGCVLALATALFMSAGAVVMRKLKHIDWVVLASWTGVAAMLYSMILTVCLDSFALPDTTDGAIITFGAAITGVLANLFFTIALHFANAGFVVIGKTTEVIFAALYQAFLFGQIITPMSAVGIAFICLSIIVLNAKNQITKVS